MTMDMLIRKKALKIQERLGMRIGVMYGISGMPVARTTDQVLSVLRELYKIGMKAFVLPRELFADIVTSADLYKGFYGDLLKIKDTAQKFNIELALHYPDLPEDPDEAMKVFCTICNVMDCRAFIISPDIYKNMPQEQSLRLAVYKINEIMTNLRMPVKMGIETTGKVGQVGSLEQVVDVVKRTRGTEVVLNWAHIHARGSGALRSEDDFRRVMGFVSSQVGRSWVEDAYFIFSGVSYGPSGEIRHIPLAQSDISLKNMIRQAVSFGVKGTLIFEDPDKERLLLRILDDLGDMVR
jgi:deoxyribonuclease-4